MEAGGGGGGEEAIDKSGDPGAVGAGMRVADPPGGFGVEAEAAVVEDEEAALVALEGGPGAGKEVSGGGGGGKVVEAEPGEGSEAGSAGGEDVLEERAVEAVGRAHPGRGKPRAGEDLGEGLVPPVEFTVDGGRGAGKEGAVGVGVVDEDVAGGVEVTGEAGVSLGAFPDEAEPSPEAVPVEDLEEPAGDFIGGVGAVVEGEHESPGRQAEGGEGADDGLEHGRRPGGFQGDSARP